MAMIVQAIVEATDTASIDEIEAARDAIRQALQMTVDAVPFLESVEVTVFDADGTELTFDTADGTDD